jgi:hypothetical protein
MFTKFIQGQNLRALLESPKLPPMVEQVLMPYAKSFKFDLFASMNRNSLISYDAQFRKVPGDTAVLNPKLLLDSHQSEIFRMFVQHRHGLAPSDIAAFVHEHHSIQTPIGKLRGRSSKSSPTVDSRVMYQESASRMRMAVIEKIFSQKQNCRDQESGNILRTFLLLHPFKELSDIDAKFDPCRFNVRAGIHLRYTALEEDLVVAELEDIRTRVSVMPFSTVAIMEDCYLFVECDPVRFSKLRIDTRISQALMKTS